MTISIVCWSCSVYRSISALLTLSAALLLFIGCGEEKGRPSLSREVPVLPFTREDATNAWKAADLLVAGHTPRDAGTPEAEAAARWLLKELKTRGITQSEVDSFTDKTPKGKKQFHNVIGHLPGTGDSWIILLSHFDTKSGIGRSFQGANDGASSTGLLLELARSLKAAGPLRHNILLGFMDGEECQITYCPYDGFHGSKRLAGQVKRSGRRVRAVILMDMVGGRNLKLSMPYNGDGALKVLALDAAETVGFRDRIGLYDGIVYDDHQAFIDRGFPAVDLIDLAFGSAPGLNDYWHTLEDSMDKVCPESLHISGKIVLEMVRRLEMAE